MEILVSAVPYGSIYMMASAIMSTCLHVHVRVGCMSLLLGTIGALAGGTCPFASCTVAQHSS